MGYSNEPIEAVEDAFFCIEFIVLGEKRGWFTLPFKVIDSKEIKRLNEERRKSQCILHET